MFWAAWHLQVPRTRCTWRELSQGQGGPVYVCVCVWCTYFAVFVFTYTALLSSANSLCYQPLHSIKAFYLLSRWQLLFIWRRGLGFTLITLSQGWSNCCPFLISRLHLGAAEGRTLDLSYPRPYWWQQGWGWGRGLTESLRQGLRPPLCFCLAFPHPTRDWLVIVVSLFVQDAFEGYAFSELSLKYKNNLRSVG